MLVSVLKFTTSVNKIVYKHLLMVQYQQTRKVVNMFFFSIFMLQRGRIDRNSVANGLGDHGSYARENVMSL